MSPSPEAPKATSVADLGDALSGFFDPDWYLSRYPDVSLAINISAVTASDASWLRTLSAGVKNRPDMATRLIVELTETVALENIEETARFVSALRALGVRVL